VVDDFVVILPADQLLERVRLQVFDELPAGPRGGGATQRRASRRPGLAAFLAKLRVPPDAHEFGRNARFLADDLRGGRVDALAHLGEAVENIHAGAVKDRNLDVAAFDGAVAEPRALHTAADTLVRGALVDVLHGVERLARTAHALAHDLPRAVLIARVADVAVAYVPAVDADALGDQVHDAFHRELRLVGAEAAHRAAVGIIRVDGFRLDRDRGHPVDPARVAGGPERALGTCRVIAAGIRDNVSLQRHQMALVVEADRVGQRHRVTL